MNNILIDFLVKIEKKNGYSQRELTEIQQMISERISNYYLGIGPDIKMNFELKVKKIDTSRRIFKIKDKKDKIFLSFINYYLKVICQENNVEFRSCNSIIKNINDNIQSFKYLVTVDISKFYDNIDRKILDQNLQNILNPFEYYILINILNEIYIEKDAIDELIINKYMDNQMLSNEKGIIVGKGIPQGIEIANILADIYMMNLKSAIGDLHYRYVDDIFVLTNNKQIQQVKKSIMDLNLELNNKSKEFKLKEIDTHILGYKLKFTNDILKVTPSQKSINRQYNRLENNLEKLKESSTYNEYIKFLIELQICGYVEQTREGNIKAYGWINYYQSVNNLESFTLLDKWIKKNINDYIFIEKKFIRSYYSNRNLNEKKNKNYLMRNVDISKISLMRKKEILNSYRGRNLDYTDSEVERQFRMLFYKELEKLEEDYGRKSYGRTNK